MRKLVLFMHASLDGFVAGPNGEMDWINVGEEMFEMAGQRTSEADTALYGRVTYEMMDAYWPTAADKANPSKHDIEHSSWYNRVSKVVLSKTMKDADRANTSFISENIPDKIRELKQQTGENILMFGSPTAAHLLMKENLIDEYWILANPILLGKGIPLFAEVTDRIKLQLVTSRVFKSGVVCLEYTTELNK